MIHTVPTGVELTDVVQLNPFKIRVAQITVINGQVVLRVMVRVSLLRVFSLLTRIINQHLTQISSRNLNQALTHSKSPRM